MDVWDKDGICAKLAKVPWVAFLLSYEPVQQAGIFIVYFSELVLIV